MSKPVPEKRIIRSSPGTEGKNQRLDCWLASRFTYRSRSEWQSAVRKGEILLNGSVSRPARILHGDETIDFLVPDHPEPSVRSDFRILAEFPQYIAVEKPGNLPVHPSGCFFNHTLLMLLRRSFGELYPVNRLDRETSGIVLFARNSGAAAKLSAALAAREVRKKYIVYVHGVFPFETLRAVGWLFPDLDSSIRKKRRFSYGKPLDGDAENCDSEFILMSGKMPISKLKCILHTGRFHQIRATLFSLGFPVVGDKLYGLDDGIFDRFADGRMTESDKETLIIDRQALHAYELEMTDPFDGKWKKFSSPIPSEFSCLESG